MRWLAEITYRTDAGKVITAHYIEEIVQLDSLVECGPDWNTIEKIEITLARVLSPGLTVEAAAHPPTV